MYIIWMWDAVSRLSNNVSTNKTLLVTSPTKDEIIEEHDMLHSIATVFERKLESSNRKVKS